MSLLQIHNVNKSFAGLKALTNVNLSVEEGSVHAIIGPNGAGKSTLLNCLIGKLQPDIGTVICPDAQVKLFITATPEVRAARRFAELSLVDPTVTLEGVLADVQARDARDSSRAEAPLKPADDAELMDTSTMDIEAAVARAIALVNARRCE